MYFIQLLKASMILPNPNLNPNPNLHATPKPCSCSANAAVKQSERQQIGGVLDMIVKSIDTTILFLIVISILQPTPKLCSCSANAAVKHLKGKARQSVGRDV